MPGAVITGAPWGPDPGVVQILRTVIWKLDILSQPGYEIHRASHGFSMALIEIEALPFLKMVICHG